MKYQPVKSWRKQTGIFNCGGIHTELRETMGLRTGAPWCMLGRGGRACFWLQEFSLTRKWVSWQNWNLACFRFLRDRRHSLRLTHKSLLLVDSQEDTSPSFWPLPSGPLPLPQGDRTQEEPEGGR